MAHPLETSDFSGRPRVEPSLDVKLSVAEGGRVSLVNPFIPTILGQFKYGPQNTVELSGSLTELVSLRDPERLGAESAVKAGTFAMLPGVGGSPSGCPQLRSVRVGDGNPATASEVTLKDNNAANVIKLTSIGLGAWTSRLHARVTTYADQTKGRDVNVLYKDDPRFVVSGKKLGPLFTLYYTKNTANNDNIRVTVTAGTPGQATTLVTAAQTAATNFAAGTLPLSVDLTSPEFDTVGKVIDFLNAQPGYMAKPAITDCDLSTLSSREIDAVGPSTISGAAADVKLTANIGSIVHWLNQNAKLVGPVEGVTAERVGAATLAPAADGGSQFLTGGADASPDSTDYQSALDLLDLNEVPSGCLFLDTSDAAIRELCLTWIDGQRAKGRMWRAVFGLPAGTADDVAMASSSAISRHYVMLVHQSVLDIQDASVTHPPLVLAAALAGATGGMNAQNDPQTLVLSNSRLRFGSISPASRRTMSQRDQLLKSGITVLKEARGRVIVSLAVSCDQGATRTWRMWSESSALDWIDQSIRDGLDASKVAWATETYVSSVRLLVRRLLDTWANPSSPVISPGTDPDTGEDVPAYSSPAVSSANGVTSVSFSVGMAGETDHIRVTGLVRKIAISATVTA